MGIENKNHRYFIRSIEPVDKEGLLKQTHSHLKLIGELMSAEDSSIQWDVLDWLIYCQLFTLLVLFGKWYLVIHQSWLKRKWNHKNNKIYPNHGIGFNTSSWSRYRKTLQRWSTHWTKFGSECEYCALALEFLHLSSFLPAICKRFWIFKNPLLRLLLYRIN